MSIISNIGDENFKEEVLDSNQLVMVDFYADWCMPCKMLSPILEEVANDNAGKVKIAKINVEKARNTSAQYGITSVPSVIFFKGGREVERVVGLRRKEDFQYLIDKLA